MIYPVYWTFFSTYLNWRKVTMMMMLMSTTDWAEDEPRLRPMNPS
jgi:hypothetical protein